MQRIKRTALAVVLALTLFIFPGSIISHAASGTLGISNRAPKVGDSVTVTVSADSNSTLQFTSKLLSADSVSGGTISGNTITFSGKTGSVTFTVKDAGDAELILNSAGTKVSSATLNAASADTSNTDTTAATDTTTDPQASNSTQTTDNSNAADDTTQDTNIDTTDATPSDGSFSATTNSVSGVNGITVAVVDPTEVPSCFTESSLPDTAESPVVYQFAGFPNTFYYFYGSNDDLGEGWYEFDASTGIVSKANSELVNAYDSLEKANNTSANPDSGSANGKDFSISSLKNKWNSLSSTNKIIFIIAIAIIIIVIIIIINIIVSCRDRHDDLDDEESDDSDAENSDESYEDVYSEDEDSEDEDSEEEDSEEEDEPDEGDETNDENEDDELSEREKKKLAKKQAKEEKKREKELLKEQRRAEKEKRREEELDLLNPDGEEKNNDEGDSNEDSSSASNGYKPQTTQVLPSVQDIREKLKEDEAAGKENPYLNNYTEISEGSEIRTGSNTKYHDEEAKHALFMARKNFYSEDDADENQNDQEINGRYVRSVKSVKTVQKEEKQAEEDKEFEEKVLYPEGDDGEEVVDPDKKKLFVPNDMASKQKKKSEISSDYNLINPEKEETKIVEEASQEPEETPSNKEDKSKNNKKNGGNGGSSGSSDIDVIDFNDL